MKSTKEQRQQVRDRAYVTRFDAPHAQYLQAAADLADDVDELEDRAQQLAESVRRMHAFIRKWTAYGYALHPVAQLSPQERAMALGNNRVFLLESDEGVDAYAFHLQHSWRPIEDFSGARTVLVARQGSGRVAPAYRHADTWQTGAGPLDFEPTHYSEALDPPQGSDTPPVSKETIYEELRKMAASAPPIQFSVHARPLVSVGTITDTVRFGNEPAISGVYDAPPIHIEPKPPESIPIDTESGLGYVAVPADTSAKLPSVSTPEPDKSE